VKRGFVLHILQTPSRSAGVAVEMVIAEKNAVTIDPVQLGLKQHEMKTSTIVFMIFCLCAAGAYGIEGLFDILISCIRWITAASGVLTVILVIIAGRVERMGAEFALESRR